MRKGFKGNARESYWKMVYSNDKREKMLTSNPTCVEVAYGKRWVEVVPFEKFEELTGILLNLEGGRISVLEVTQKKKGGFTASGMMLEQDNGKRVGTKLKRKAVDVNKLQEIERMLDMWHKCKFSVEDVKAYN